MLHWRGRWAELLVLAAVLGEVLRELVRLVEAALLEVLLGLAGTQVLVAGGALRRAVTLELALGWPLLQTKESLV